MTLLQSFLGYKKVKKAEWLAREIDALEREFDADLTALEAEKDSIVSEKEKEVSDMKKAYEKQIMDFEKSKKSLELAQFDLDELMKRVDDKKEEYAKKNKELATQIRLLEAKATPDNIWISAFQSGFSKAWGMMKPMMYEGFEKVKQEISDNAKMETINGLQSVLRGKDGFDSEKD